MEHQKKKSLSEISHLFLSSVRDNATGGQRPTRIPPGGERVATRPGVPPVPRSAMSIDLTPEEYARAISENEAVEAAPERAPVGPVSALICSQFNGHQLERAKEYAQHLAATGERVGLIQIDPAECSITCFETARNEFAEPIEPVVANTLRQMSEAMEELAWDIDRWILLVPSPRTPEARNLLRKVNHWTLLSTCDHDGVVSCYRAIKGLAEMPRPRLTLALLNAPDKTEAGKVYRKIASVCEQFLNWTMEAEPAVEAVDSISENLTLVFHPSRERAELSVGTQWEVISDFLTLAAAEQDLSQTTTPAGDGSSESQSPSEPDEPWADAPEISPEIPADTMRDTVRDTLGDTIWLDHGVAQPNVQSQAQSPTQPRMVIEPSPVVNSIPPVSPFAGMPLAASTNDDDCDVADLPDGEVTEAVLLRAVMSKANSGLVECPIRPPACPQATLAVNRDRRLVLLAVARKGLTELRAIATAYRWVIENRPLLSMALPQFAIDTHALPALKLIIDRADTGADLLLPMNENSNVTVQTYRKLKWSGKTGLLLEAA